MKMKLRIAAVILAAVMFVIAVPAFASDFSDVKGSRWSAEDVAYAVEKGYMNGTGDGKFSPAAAMTRGMVVTVLYRREGSPWVRYSPEFTDVPENAYYTSAVIWAKNAGIVNGTSATTFSPSANVTREQLAAMLMRYTDFLHYTTRDRANLGAFTDSGAISSYAKDAVAWAVKTGLITGTTATTLSPGSQASREQFAAILRRYDGVRFEHINRKAKFELLYPAEGDVISVLNPLQATFVRRFYMGDFDDPANPSAVYDWLAGSDSAVFRSGGHNPSYPAMINFRWTCDDPVRIQTVEISEDEDFSAKADVTTGSVFALTDGVYSCNVTNFRLGTTYYWRVRTDFRSISDPQSFTTAWDRYRPIYLEGGTNIRDIGGRVNAEGKRIRQGAIFRGAEPECYDCGEPNQCLTVEGRRQMAQDLGIKTRLDLQEESLEGLHMQGEWYGIEYFVRPCGHWTDTLYGTGAEWLKEIMEVALDTSKYPLYFHCHAGADRTGTIGAYLDILLGMDMEDVIFDYDVTSLSIVYKRSWYGNGEEDEGDSSRVQFIKALAEKYPDLATPREQVEEYLVSLGIEREKIEAFRDYMILD